ncbi:MAG: aspartate/glutamate racemase family protein [Pseudomonadales bacterium]|nr:aspartate/glutamate racemase family protein [Pseudomonadales bacterium]
MKTTGIIGGLGPDTTSKFYLQVIEKAKTVDPENRPPLLIWNVPMNLKEESAFIEGEDRQDYYLELLTEGVQKLEAGGADFIIILCNSVHVFIEDLRKIAQIPVLSIIEETAQFLENHDINQVGLLATSATINSQLYHQPLESKNVSITTPDNQSQQKLNQSITCLVNHEHTAQDTQVLNTIIGNLADSGVQTTLLACTDLQLATPSHPTVAIYDTMHILVDSTVREIFSDES